MTRRAKKGYSAPFGTRHAGSNQFHFENGCWDKATAGKDNIQELSMFAGKTWQEAGSKPKAYR